MKKLLYPHVPLRLIPGLLLLALIGSVIAGTYGVIHDQITFTLGPEYFTKFKFEQFAYADFNLPDRGFVAVIGFLATWWVGMIAGWILGRASILPDGRVLPVRMVARQFVLLLAAAVVFGFIGYLYGTITYDAPKDGWEWGRSSYGSTDLSRFARVGHIHNCGYLGALLGLVVSAIVTRRQARRDAGISMGRLTCTEQGVGGNPLPRRESEIGP